jgi:hypothetical protein
MAKHVPRQYINPTDMYEKQLNTQVENNMLREQSKQDKITITRLQRDLKARDRLISKYIDNDRQLSAEYFQEGNSKTKDLFETVDFIN